MATNSPRLHLERDLRTAATWMTACGVNLGQVFGENYGRGRLSLHASIVKPSTARPFSGEDNRQYASGRIDLIESGLQSEADCQMH